FFFFFFFGGGQEGSYIYQYKYAIFHCEQHMSPISEGPFGIRNEEATVLALGTYVTTGFIIMTFVDGSYENTMVHRWLRWVYYLLMMIGATIVYTVLVMNSVHLIKSQKMPLPKIPNEDEIEQHLSEQRSILKRSHNTNAPAQFIGLTLATTQINPNPIPSTVLPVSNVATTQNPMERVTSNSSALSPQPNQVTNYGITIIPQVSAYRRSVVDEVKATATRDNSATANPTEKIETQAFLAEAWEEDELDGIAEDKDKEKEKKKKDKDKKKKKKKVQGENAKKEKEEEEEEDEEEEEEEEDQGSSSSSKKGHGVTFTTPDLPVHESTLHIAVTQQKLEEEHEKFKQEEKEEQGPLVDIATMSNFPIILPVLTIESPNNNNNNNAQEYKNADEHKDGAPLLLSLDQLTQAMDEQDVDFMTPDLLRILSRAEYIKVFYEWLLWEHSLENLLFLVDVMQFKQAVASTLVHSTKIPGWRMTFPSNAIPSESIILNTCTNIYDRMQLLYEIYIPTRSQLELNLLPRSQVFLNWKFNGGGFSRNLPPEQCITWFDNVAKEVSQLLLHSLDRFVCSQVFMLFIFLFFFLLSHLFNLFFFKHRNIKRCFAKDLQLRPRHLRLHRHQMQIYFLNSLRGIINLLIFFFFNIVCE
ncbi:hypothetical protein RFI_17420, partial [Reticulomyxa filosa]